MNRHDTDAVSLTAGALFLAVVAAWLLSRTVHIGLPSVGWLVAAALILAGLLGLAVTVRPSRR
jgi:hypothetical protein